MLLSPVRCWGRGLLMKSNSMFWRVFAGIAIVVGSIGCDKSVSGDKSKADSSNSPPAAAANAAGSTPAASGLDQEAQAAVMDELLRHYDKGADGWTTLRVSGSAYAPDRYLRQFRKLTVHNVESFDLDESDKLNGFEWAGQVDFESSPCREAGDSGIILEGISNAGMSVNRQRGRWTQWVDFQPEAIKVQKVKGKWQIQQDTVLLRGSKPQPQDYASAGVH
jgi:hypothetical protein